MREHVLQRIPVIDEARRPLGIICARDALQVLLTESEKEDSCFATTYPESGIGNRKCYRHPPIDRRHSASVQRISQRSRDAPPDFKVLQRREPTSTGAVEMG